MHTRTSLLLSVAVQHLSVFSSELGGVSTAPDICQAFASGCHICDDQWLRCANIRVCVCINAKRLLYVLMCVTANGCELPATHGSIIKHSKLRVVSFVLFHLQSQLQTYSSKNSI